VGERRDGVLVLGGGGGCWGQPGKRGGGAKTPPPPPPPAQPDTLIAGWGWPPRSGSLSRPVVFMCAGFLCDIPPPPSVISAVAFECCLFFPAPPQCSVTCGEGMERRLVTCRIGDQCNSDKPETVRFCRPGPCHGNHSDAHPLSKQCLSLFGWFCPQFLQTNQTLYSSRFPLVAPELRNPSRWTRSPFVLLLGPRGSSWSHFLKIFLPPDNNTTPLMNLHHAGVTSLQIYFH